MVQRIILIHGRSTKPAKAKHAKFLKAALMSGLKHVDPQKAAKIGSTVKVDYVYYGDINNAILAKSSKKIAEELKGIDPDADQSLNDGRCLPDAGYLTAINAMNQYRPFHRRDYKRLKKNHKSNTWLDDVARAASTVSAIATATLFNEAVIKFATADLGAYLTTRTYGSKIRERLHSPLKNALLGGDDVCLVAHSMGAIVSYDVLWKFSRMSEYRDVQNAQTPISMWLTLGSPLGEAGVKANLYDARERSHRGDTDKFPKHIIDVWHNVAAHDDFISHDATMRNDFREMKTRGFLSDIVDHKIYNCWAFDDEINPHKFYGYLVNPRVAGLIAAWIK
ncbi:hypothetical protein [Shimia sp.]|uniref:hypothetical protein n=1 Tax=Shimia sp. TaxID=1954381 RepID=UPI003BA922AF